MVEVGCIRFRVNRRVSWVFPVFGFLFLVFVLLDGVLDDYEGFED